MKKGTYDNKKVLAVKKLAKEFNYTPEYIRQCLRGDSKSEVVPAIRKRYTEIYQQLTKALS